MGEHVEVIGIDHGYRNMKTANFIFPTAIMKLESRPDDYTGILRVKDDYYSIEGGRRLISVDNHNKIQTQDFYLLTLVCIAKELRGRGKIGSKVRIAAGLPQKWHHQQKTDFKSYLLQNARLDFAYENLQYNVEFAGAGIYTQGYAAAAVRLANRKNTYCVIVDIGGETMDITPVLNGRPVEDECRIDTRACIWLINSIKEQIESELMEAVHEQMIAEFIDRADRDTKPRNKYEEVMKRCVMDFCDMVFTRLREFKFNVELTPFIFVGGGAGLIYRFAAYNEEMTEFVLDICANAKGYERIDKALASRNRQQ